MIDLKVLKFASIFILFILSFIFCNIPILISCLIKRYFIKYKIKLSSNSQFVGLKKACCTNKLAIRNNEFDIDDEDNLNLNNSDENDIKIEISIKSYFMKYNIISTYITCFSSGIFLATSMLELLPNVVKNVNDIKLMFDSESSMEEMSSSSSSVFMMSHEMPDLKNSTISHFLNVRLTKFPLGEFFIVLGILLVMLIEQSMMYFNERNSNKKSFKNKIKYEKIVDNPHCSEQINDQSVSLDETEQLIDNKNTIMKVKKDDYVIKTRIIVLLIALSIHSIFEGLTIGLQTQHHTLVNVIIAISVHKCLIAFSFGQQLIENLNRFSNISVDINKFETGKGISYRYLIFNNFIFSISNPFGILIAILIVDVYSSTFSTLLVSLIKAISCGTFIYITFFEILPNELNNSIGSRLLKVFFIYIGFLIFSIIIFLN
jgi:zinc transporter 1/2/3